MRVVGVLWCVCLCACSAVPATDGGLSDSGVNPGDADAGGADAGDADAGSLQDAGLPDAGAIDAGPACGPATLTAACDAAHSTAPNAGDYGSTGPNAVLIETLPNPRPGATGVITIFRPNVTGRVPVLFFSHAFAATNPDIYAPLFTVLASNGYAVVHVPYPSLPGGNCQNAERYETLWDGFRAAATAYGASFDLNRVGFVGHSFGGGATPELARRAFVGLGWGAQGRLLFIMAPWYSWGSEYETLPADTKVVLQVYADDEANDHRIAVEDVWNRLPSTLERRWQLIRTDVCGACGLNAPHSLPMQNKGISNNPQSVENGLDRWAVYRRLHALARYALQSDASASARAVALGDDASMGEWLSCQRPVRPMESGVAPITASCVAPMYRWEGRAAAADTGANCR